MLPLHQRPCSACSGNCEDKTSYPCEVCRGYGTMGMALYQFRKIDPFFRDKPTPSLSEDHFFNDAERMRFQVWMERNRPRS
jgi:hypothetical protein